MSMTSFFSLASSILILLLHSFLRGLRRWLAGVRRHERMRGFGALGFSATKLKKCAGGKELEVRGEPPLVKKGESKKFSHR
ncbi:hypothetical protein BO99DRAFT_196180 [Aspergillus violaceofuscus CBS 115571]|uniref:Uncharacterized protein n=1 Tax=Aspergillus violaceofuscus (strain CBS 115571) TaxID=1450538 RepID=A0A2V5H067_ASPV1|nr:hypothetical protein BO99DRAFT_196180 [Aspergillus violaceofuscus CBS 115571]